MKTKGVDSVSSPIGNISWALDRTSVPSPIPRVMSDIVAAFGDMYGVASDAVLQAQMAHPSEPEVHSGDNWVVGTVGDWQVEEDSRIQEGVQELKVRGSHSHIPSGWIMNANSSTKITVVRLGIHTNSPVHIFHSSNR